MTHTTATIRALAVLGLAAGLAACGSVKSAASSVTAAPTSVVSTAPTTAAPPTTVPAPTTTVTTLSPAQQNAISSAQQYLSTAAFSRLGLIQQLSSSAGSGYPLSVATFAVDSLHENWNLQAVKAAKEYLKTEPFSCSDLTAQLSSSAGSQFTPAQAQYGATAAGIC